MTISKRINEIMSPQELLKHLLAYAKIDYIMNPDSDDYMYRVYHYDGNWVENGHFLKIDNNGGDHYHILFSPAGCIIKGFDHESELNPYNFGKGEKLPDLYQGAPDILVALMEDPALEKDLVTFCVWCGADETRWQTAPSTASENRNDGIDTFLHYAHDLKQHSEWFEEYYESELSDEILESIFGGAPVTADIVAELNPEADLVLSELAENF